MGQGGRRTGRQDTVNDRGFAVYGFRLSLYPLLLPAEGGTQGRTRHTHIFQDFIAAVE